MRVLSPWVAFGFWAVIVLLPKDGNSQPNKKLLRVDPTPLMPKDQQALIEELPRDADVVEVFKKVAGVDPLPTRK